MSMIYLRWFGGLVLLLAFLVSPPMSQAQCQLSADELIPLAAETLTVSTTALPLTATVYSQVAGTAQYAWITVETAAIRYDYTRTPTAAVGQLVTPPASDSRSFPVCSRLAITQFRAIRVTADATINVIYYRRRSNPRP